VPHVKLGRLNVSEFSFFFLLQMEKFKNNSNDQIHSSDVAKKKGYIPSISS